GRDRRGRSAGSTSRPGNEAGRLVAARGASVAVRGFDEGGGRHKAIRWRTCEPVIYFATLWATARLRQGKGVGSGLGRADAWSVPACGHRDGTGRPSAGQSRADSQGR